MILQVIQREKLKIQKHSVLKVHFSYLNIKVGDGEGIQHLKG